VIRWQGQRKLGRRKGGSAATLSAVLVSRLIMWPRRSSATHRFRKAISAPRSPRAGCRGNGLAPDFPGGVDHKSELCALLTSVIGSPAAALAKPHWGLIARAVEVEVSGRVLDAASEHIHILKLRRLAADETQHDALRSGHQSQRSKAPGPGGYHIQAGSNPQRRRSQQAADMLGAKRRNSVRVRSHLDADATHCPEAAE
jgi:hypothetical protein